MEIQKVNDIKEVAVWSEKLKVKEKLSYGFGGFASNLMWGVIGSFLLYFYTDVALIPVAATGTIFLISRVLDAFIDPVIGGFIDRTYSKWGRTKPYIIFGIIPLSVFYVLSFTTIGGSDLTKTVYAYITFIICGLLYSVVNIPYGALMPLMTRDSDEKNQLSSFRMGGMALGNILVSVATLPLVNYLGGGNQQVGFMWTTTLFAIIGCISFLVIVKNCKERFVEQKPITREKINIIDTYKTAFRNGPWVSTVFFALLMFIKIGAIVSITIYYCMQVLKSPAMISILLSLFYVTVFVASFITPTYLKKFQIRKGNIISQATFIVGFAILPLFAENHYLFIAVYFIANLLNALSAGSVFSMTANSVDFNEWKFGKRAEGTLYAGYSFATKVGMAVGGAVIGYVLAFVGYDAQNVTESAVDSINFLYFFIPILVSVLQIIATSFYKLDKIHPQIVKELNDRVL